MTITIIRNTILLSFTNPIVLTLKTSFEIIRTILALIDTIITQPEIIEENPEVEISKPFLEMVGPLRQIVDSALAGEIDTETAFQRASLLFYQALPPDYISTEIPGLENLKFLYPIAELIGILHNQTDPECYDGCQFSQGFMRKYIYRRLVVNGTNKHWAFQYLINHPGMRDVDKACGSINVLHEPREPEGPRIAPRFKSTCLRDL